MQHHTIPLSLLFGLILAATGAAQRLYVDASIGTSGDGSTWAKVYRSLSAALAAANSGTDVWVAEGKYTGGFTIPPGVSVFGGLASGDARLNERDIGDKATLLDGNRAARVVTLGQGSVVDGCWLQNGQTGAPGGAGVLVLGVKCTVRNCVLTGNNITGGRGSSIYVGRDGNGRGADPLFENTLVIDNGNLTSIGHTIDVEYSMGTFRNVCVDRNHDNGLHMQNGCTTRIYNSVFTNNSGRGLCHIDAATSPTLENNLIWNNAISLYHFRGKEYRDIKDVNNLSYAKNNISADPRFVDPKKLDYSLQSISPLIDAGQDIAGAALQDVDRNSRRLDGKMTGLARTDIGPIEYSNVYIEAAGTQMPGSMLTIDSDGKNGAPLLMAVGLPTSAPFFLPDLGFVFVDLGTAVLVPWPTVGNSLTILIPGSTPIGTALLLQGAAGAGAWGNLSNPLDIRIR